jgi:DNA-binding NarL/FixJ family response regulator
MLKEVNGVLLSDQQIEIARMVGKAYTNKEIARAMYLSVGSIDHHLRVLYDRIALVPEHNLRVQLARWAWENLEGGTK